MDIKFERKSAIPGRENGKLCGNRKLWGRENYPGTKHVKTPFGEQKPGGLISYSTHGAGEGGRFLSATRVDLGNSKVSCMGMAICHGFLGFWSELDLFVVLIRF